MKRRKLLRKSDSQLKKKTGNIADVMDLYIHENMTVSEFLDAINKNPNSLFSNLKIRYAVDVLQTKSLIGNPRESKIAQTILRKANLGLFVPQGAKYRETSTRKLQGFFQNKHFLFDEIDKVERRVRAIWGKYDHRQVKSIGIKNIIKEMIKEIYGCPNPEDGAIKIITRGERDSAGINIALSLFAFRHDISYSTLRKFYFNKQTTKERAEYQKLKEKDNNHETQWYDGIPFDYYAELIGRNFMSFPFLCNDKECNQYFEKLKEFYTPIHVFPMPFVEV